jgi:hypothetical protein
LIHGGFPLLTRDNRTNKVYFINHLWYYSNTNMNTLKKTADAGNIYGHTIVVPRGDRPYKAG